MANFSIFVSLLFILIATAVVVFSFVADSWSWQNAAVVILLYTKGVRGMVIGFRLRSSSRSQKIVTAKDIRITAGAFLLTAVLFFVSWLVGEGVLGLFGAIGFANVTWILWFAARRIEAV